MTHTRKRARAHAFVRLVVTIFCLPCMLLSSGLGCNDEGDPSVAHESWRSGDDAPPLPSATSMDERLDQIAGESVLEGEMWISRSAWNTVAFLAAPTLEIPTTEATPENAAIAFLTDESLLFGLDSPTISLVAEQDHFDDAAGESIVRVSQTHQGLPVWNAGATVRVGTDATIRLVSSTLVPDTILSQLEDARPALATAEAAADAAVDEAISVLVAEEGIWVDASGTTVPRVAEAWRIELVSTDDRRHAVLVGPGGEVLENHTLGQQAKHLGLYSWNGGWDLIFDDFCHPDPPPVNCTACPLFWCALWGCVAPGQWPGAAEKTMENQDETYYYFLNEHGLDSWDGNGGLMWVGTNYGAGCFGEWVYNRNNHPIVQLTVDAGECLDIVAHEHTHLIDLGHNSVLGLSGMLSEGVPDIFAQFVEKHVHGQTDWVFQGANCSQACQSGARSLADPESTGHHGNYAAVPGLAPYTFSMVPGKAAYLMGREPSEGAETYWGVSVTGTGATDAEQIWYQSLWACLPPNAQMGHLRDCLVWRGCSAPYGQSTCDAVHGALDAIGLFRQQQIASPTITTPREVAIAKVSGGNADDQFIFYQDYFYQDQDHVWFRERSCPKTTECTSQWGAPTSLGVSWTGNVAAAARGNHIYVAGRPASGGVELLRYNANNGQVTQLHHFTGTGYDPEGGVTMAEYDGDIYIYWKINGSQFGRGVQWSPTGGGSWADWGVNVITTVARPTLASGTMDGYDPDPNKGLWLFYQDSIANNGIRYREWDPSSGWSTIESAGTQSDLTDGAPGVAIWRDRLHLVARTDSSPSQTFHKSCPLPCSTPANDWTHWREHDLNTGTVGLTLVGQGPVLELWHRPSLRVHSRFKFGD
jgi:hypothetical protein